MKESTPLSKRLMLSLFAFLMVMSASAQVIINPHPIAGFQFSSKDILNFDVVFSHTESIKVQYEASLQDANGRLVVQYISGTHILKPGANSYTPSTYNIAETRYINRTIGGIERTTKFLPSGDYTFCINLKCVDTREVCERAIQIELDYSACSDAHAEPITPLLLSFPDDESEIEEKRPNFTWIPPMPIGNDPNLTYTFNLVKMLNDQTAEDAIRRNRSLYKQEGIRNISLMFPNQLDDLEEGEHYAWQVSAHIGDQHIATSDVWEFEVEKEEVRQSVPRVTRVSGSHFHAARNGNTEFYFEWKSMPEVNTTLEFKILDSEQSVIADNRYFDAIGVKVGLNFAKIPVCDIFLINTSYTLVMKGEGGQTYYHHFILKESSCN